MMSLSIYLIYFLFAFIKSTEDDLIFEHQDIESKTILHANYSVIGSFWQITDIHWDLEYNEFGDKTNMCHESSEEPQNKSVGYYGNYLCDAPYPLIHSALQAVKKIKPLPNFILWTGDNTPHTDVNFSIIFRTIKNLTEEMVTIFGPKVPLIPVLGNHDASPKDDYPPSGENFYSRYLLEGGWKDIISPEAQEDFKKGGYYKILLPSDVDVLVLNTNLYYKYNELGQGLKDPGDQFNWMRNNLLKAKDANRKVIIAAHAPPGYWERNAQVPFFNESYNDEYVDILNDFGEIIIAHIYGHEHTDSFRIFKTGKDLKSVGFLAPSLTPWFPTRLEGGTAINPSVRLYSYAHHSLLDYVQYHLNLTEANNNGTATEACASSPVMGEVEECEEVLRAQWKEYYRAREAFGVNSLHVEEMARVYERLISDDSYFQKYYLRNSAGVEHGYCNNSCKKSHFCAISHLKIQELFLCSGQSSGFTLSHTSVAVVAIGVSLTLMLSAMFLIIGIRRRRMERGLRYAQANWGIRHSVYRPLINVDND